RRAALVYMRPDLLIAALELLHLALHRVRVRVTTPDLELGLARLWHDPACVADRAVLLAGEHRIAVAILVVAEVGRLSAGVVAVDGERHELLLERLEVREGHLDDLS